MSHNVTCVIEVTNKETFKKAVLRIEGALFLEHGVHAMFERPVEGYGARLPGWKYPVIVENKQLVYDNYGGSWGDIATLDRIMQNYTVLTLENEAYENHAQCEVTELENGDLQLEIMNY